MQNIDCVACFTGHRPEKIGGYDENNPQTQFVKLRLSMAIEDAIQKGYRNFISGMALGVDTIAARLVLSKRQRGANIRLICAVPFEGQEEKWPEQSQELYRSILRKADAVKILFGRGYAKWKMLKRDDWMVNHSSRVIAVWDGSDSGTGHTVQFAKEQAAHNPEIILIDPRDYRNEHH